MNEPTRLPVHHPAPIPQQPSPRPTTEFRRDQALELLARGIPPSEAAQALGISARTLRRYLQNGELLKELRRMQAERLEALLRASLMAAPSALLALHAIASSHASSERARVSAARAIIEHTLRLHESVDLTQRVERLEDLAASEPAVEPADGALTPFAALLPDESPLSLAGRGAGGEGEPPLLPDPATAEAPGEGS